MAAVLRRAIVDRTRWVGEALDSRRPVPVSRSAFAGFRFPAEVITVAVRWYMHYGLSYRDVEELLAERSVEIDQVTEVHAAVRRRGSLHPARAR